MDLDWSLTICINISTNVLPETSSKISSITLIIFIFE